PRMDHYEDVYRAVAYLAFRHGRIHRLDSNNEHWLALEAQLREDFNVEGLRPSQIALQQSKRGMAQVYEAAGIPHPPEEPVVSPEQVRRFARVHGVPLIFKPDVGVGAARVRDLFAEARGMAPAIVFIDEIDAIGAQRGGGTDGATRETESTLNQILIELDGFGGSEGVVVMAATNRAEILDPALVRPGRFDRTITLELPHRDARREILKVHGHNKPLSPAVDLDAVASQTSGFSGADLANLLNEAALLAIRRRKRQITSAEIGDAMDRVLLGVAGTHRISDEQRRIVAYHEAGHAVVGHALPGARVPHRLSVIPRGRTLGAVLTREEDGDRLLHSRSTLLDEMAALLGGHTAEALVFDEVTSGAAGDLLRVNQIARQMVLELGMSEGFGVVTHGDGERGADHSDETARRIDEEVSRLVTEAQARARGVLERSRVVLDRVAAAVIEREVLTGDELAAILAGDAVPAVRR
ncbi:MAG: AAA family ATPase, partial [Actinobacteria bacterium]|nr:AAA family ATPase [Actinomycetota bacterium]